MKMKFGAIVVDGRGKIGGHVASKNRAGAYLRTKVTPVNAQTSYQLAIRNRFTLLSQAWRGLAQAARDAWNAAVADFSKTDIFGDLRQPSGFNLYEKLNNNLVTVGEVAIDVPPLPSAVGEVVAVSLAVDEIAATMSLVLTDAVPAGTAVKVFATAPLSAGKASVKSEFRLISVLAALAATPVALKVAYEDKFGSVGLEGQKVFVKLVAINTITGQSGTPSQVSAIVTAIVV